MAQASEPDLQHKYSAAESKQLQFSHQSIHKQHFREGICEVKFNQNTLQSGVNACMHKPVFYGIFPTTNSLFFFKMFVLRPFAGMQS